MTTIRQIIYDAFRESGIVAAGEVPEAAEYTEAFNRLAVFIKSLVGNELGDRLVTLNYGDYGLNNTYAQQLDESSFIHGTFIPANSRIVFNNNSAQTLYFPPDPSDGTRIAVVDNAKNFATYNIVLDGNGRTIETANTVTLATNGLTREWFYRADLGDWYRLTDLNSNAESPFPLEYDDLLVLSLALRINPRYGAETKEETIEAIRRARMQFKARYKQTNEVKSEDALLRLRDSYRYGLASTSDAFDLGII